MFKSFLGFDLVKEYHSTRADNRFHPSKRNQIIIKSAIVLLATLLLWNLPSSAFGIEGLTIVQQRVIAIFAFATLMWILEIVPHLLLAFSEIGFKLF